MSWLRRLFDRTKKAHQDLLAAFAYLAFSLGFTWPLALRLGEAVPGPNGDNLYFVWLIQWYQKALLEQGRLPLHVPQLNYPQGWNLAYSEPTPAMALLGLPGSLLGGPAWGYNSVVLCSFVLSGYFMFVWVRRLTAQPWAGLVAGMLFAFAPYRLSHLMGHLPLMGTQWLPLYFLFLDRSLRPLGGALPGWKNPLLAALFLGLAGLSSMYYLYMLLALTVVYAAGLILLAQPSSLKQRWLYRQALLLITGCGAVVVLAAWPFLDLMRSASTFSHSMDDVLRFSAYWNDFLLPSSRHFLWGRWLANPRSNALWVESTLYLGFVGMALAIIGTWHGWRSREMGRLVRPLVVTALAALILAMGPYLTWQGQPVKIPSLARLPFILSDGQVALPGYYLFKFLPFYNGMRAWTRYGILTMLSVSVLAGIGFNALARQLPSHRLGAATSPVFGLLCLALIGLDYYQPIQALTSVKPKPVDVWLGQQPDPALLAVMPYIDSLRAERVYATLYNRKPYLSAFYGTFTPSQTKALLPVLVTFPSQAALDILKQYGVGWLVVISNRYPDFAPVELALRQAGWQLVMIFEDGTYVFRMK